MILFFLSEKITIICLVISMAKQIVTIKIEEAKYNKIKDLYSPFFIDQSGDYIDFVAHKNELEITGYFSKKSRKSIVFKGELENIKKELASFGVDYQEEEKKIEEELHYVDFGEQIGSDEVGVGDFFLPMIVVAAYMNKHQYQRLKELGVTDSKKISDSKIREIGPILVKEFEYSKLTLPNEKYNEMIAKGENLNSLKAKMHNRALYNLHKKYEDVIAIYVDQFVKEETYYRYLNDENEPVVKGISFKTKGESRFPCVALASVIARYSFLLEKDKLEKKYGLSFPFGAGKEADKFKKILLEKVGQEEFDKLVKKNFKNYSSN